MPQQGQHTTQRNPLAATAVPGPHHRGLGMQNSSTKHGRAPLAQSRQLSKKCLEWLTWFSRNHKVVELDVLHDLLQDRNYKVSYIPLVNNALQCISVKPYATSLLRDAKGEAVQGGLSDLVREGPCNSSVTRWGARVLTIAKSWILLRLLLNYMVPVW